MGIRLSLFVSTGLILLVPISALADVPLHDKIDQLIAKGLPNYQSKAAPVAGDEEFLRRIYLDLHGVIPSVDEARSFFNDSTPDKRIKLIDKLLAHPRFARHLQITFDTLWMERRPDKYVKSAQWQKYLYDSFAQNKPYDQLVREVLAANDAKTQPAAKFFLDRQGEPNLITKDVSRLFLGMNLQCAQCHDHPMVNAYKQEHYYGIFAFFNRSYLFTDKKAKKTVLAEKAVGEVSFSSVFVPKVTKKTGPRLPFGSLIKEPAFPKGKEYVVKPSKTKGGVPKFSRREKLAPMLADSGYKQFKRTAANRFWALFLGRGIVHPVDFDHPENPPSHPELLELLAGEFARQKFNIKNFVREIVLSKTYQRSSRMPEGKKMPAEQYFAVAQLRALSPEQMAWATMQATGNLEAEKRRQGKKANEPAIYARLAKSVGPFINIFGGKAGDPADLGFQATLEQSLFMRNGTNLRNWLAPRTGSLTHRLIQHKNPDDLAEELFLSVLTRRPTMEEKKDVADFLAHGQTNRTTAIQEMAWALLASSEFRFNH